MPWERRPLGAQASCLLCVSLEEAGKDACAPRPCAPRRLRSQAAVARLLKAYYYPRARIVCNEKSHDYAWKTKLL